MAKFLSETGLQTVWSKIDSLFVRKASIVSAPTANSTSPISAGGVYSALEEIEDTVAASENALNTRVTTLENNTVSGSGLTANKLVLGNGGRTVKTSTYGVTTTAPSSSSNDTTIPTSKAVWSAFGSVASALKYKGTIASSGGTVTALPASHAVGDVYVVKTAGTYAGKACEVGDYIICNTAGTSANNAHWDVLNGENQVENKSASLAAAGSSATIATVDGTDLTVTTPSTWTGLAKTGTVTSVTPGTGLRNGTATTAITSSGTLNLISATTGELGGIKAAAVRTATNLSFTTGGTTSGRYYGVELDGNNKAFVNVPWEANTHNSHALTVTNGTASAASGTITYVESVTGCDATTGNLTATTTRKSVTIPTVNDKNIKISDGTNTKTISTGNASADKTLTISASQNITATVGGSDGAATLTLTGPTIKQDGITGATVNRYGTCSIAAGTAAKTVNITTGTFSLETGAKVTVYFSNKNTADNPTLNVNSTGGKRIYDGNALIGIGTNKGLLSGAVDFVYNSTLNSGVGAWQIVGNYNNSDVRFADFFGESTTAAGTAAKDTTNNSRSYNGLDLVDGLSAIIWHQYANSGTNATLNVGGSGAKAAYNASGTRISGSTGTWTAGDIIRWVYDTSLNSGSGGWKISTWLGNGSEHRFRLLTGGKTALYSGTTLDSISDGSTRKLANYLPLSGGTMTGDITINGASVLPLTDATSGATSGLGYLGSSSRRFRAGYIRDIFTSYFNFIDGDTAATLGSINFMSGAAFLRPVDETDSNKFFDYKFYVNSTSNGFFYEEGTGVCVPLGKSDHRWSKVWATDADFSGTTTVGGSIYPSSDITSHLGTSSYRFNSASIVNHYNTRNIVFKDQTTGNNCVQFWGGDGYLRVSTGANIDSSKKEIIFHESYGLYPEVGTTTNLGYYSSTDNRFRWANVYAVNGNFSGTIVANGQTVLDESMALTTSEIDTILANAT